MNKLFVILLLLLLSVLLNTSIKNNRIIKSNTIVKDNSYSIKPQNKSEPVNNYKNKRENYLLLDPSISSQSLKIANSKYKLP